MVRKIWNFINPFKNIFLMLINLQISLATMQKMYNISLHYLDGNNLVGNAKSMEPDMLVEMLGNVQQDVKDGGHYC